MKGEKYATFCKQCNQGKTERFCSHCMRVTEDLIKIEVFETIKVRTLVGLLTKREGFKRFLRKTISGWKPSGDPSLTEGVDFQMVVDRENNEYHQVVKNAETGEILHEEHEVLTDHKQRGKTKK